jgi:hypothetical protein
MSIFKESFKPNIRTQLEKRQDAMLNRTPQNLQYLNSRNSWIRMSSAVNIVTDVDEETGEIISTDDGALAKQYILQGGTLNYNKNINDATLKSGLGDFSKAYSNKAVDGISYQRGIRPMPGITGIEVKSRGAYGSIRDVTVNFQCWDIKQLEDLELLYMRPGYTVLVEWGWSPYLDNKGELQTQVKYYDIINQVKTKEQIWKDLAAKSEENGNYEAHFGYVKNYSWTARMDGGYDCQTTIISLGEVLESLKVNYTPTNNLSSINNYGLLSPNVEVNGKKPDISKMNLSGSYSKNILAGLFEELWEIGIQSTPPGLFGSATSDKGNSIKLSDKTKKTDYSLFHKTININKTANGTSSTGTVGKSDEQIYIALESLTDILNNYVLLRDNNTSGQKQPFTKITTKEKGYEDIKPTPALSTSGSGYLLALAHPLQISVDPTVCLIRNDLWSGGLKITADTVGIDATQGSSIVKYSNKNYDTVFWKTLIEKIQATYTEYKKGGPKSDDLVKYVQSFVGTGEQAINELKEISRIFFQIKDNKNLILNYKVKNNKTISQYNSFINLLLEGLSADDLYKAINTNNSSKLQFIAASERPSVTDQIQLDADKKSLEKSQNKGVEGLKFLKNIDRPYYINNDWSKELGIIGNIYVNVNMLYNLSTDDNLAGQDKKEKNEIALYDFIKSILSKISSAIGNVNNFDLFIEPNESVIRIIDINYVDRESDRDKVYKEAFQLEVHNLKSTVRSYKLESKIFPEQSTQIAIGAQTGGGALGIDASSLIDFNKKIYDRIIPVKDSPTTSTQTNSKGKIDELAKNLGTLYTFFGRLNYSWYGDSNFDVDRANDYRNALKDLISFFLSISNSNIKNRAIIPTIFSVEMDGIGGLIIGNIFKVDPNLLPKGYKGGQVGSQLGYVITTLGHSIQNGDWITKFDAQTIILDKPSGTHIDFSSLDISNKKGSPTTTIYVDNKGNVLNTENIGDGSIAEDNKKYPLLVKYNTWKAEYNSTVQESAKVSRVTPVADSLRKQLDKNYIIEKGEELSSNGDITEELKFSVLKFQSQLIDNKVAFNFITPSSPLVITAGNDTYHRTYGEKRNRTTHSRGLAIDIRTNTFNQTQINSISNLLRKSGFDYVLYHDGSAFHIHANIKTT